MDAVVGPVRAHPDYRKVVNEVFDPSWEMMKSARKGLNVFRSGYDGRTEKRVDFFGYWRPEDLLLIIAIEADHQVLYIKADALCILKVDNSKVSLIDEAIEEPIVTDMVMFLKKDDSANDMGQRTVARGSPTAGSDGNVVGNDLAADLAIAAVVNAMINQPIVQNPPLPVQPVIVNPPLPILPAVANPPHPILPVVVNAPPLPPPPPPPQNRFSFDCDSRKIPQMRGRVTVEDDGTTVTVTNQLGEEIRFKETKEKQLDPNAPKKLICSRRMTKAGHPKGRKCSGAVFLTRPITKEDVKDALDKMEFTCRWKVVS